MYSMDNTFATSPETKCVQGHVFVLAQNTVVFNIKGNKISIGGEGEVSKLERPLVFGGQ